MPWAPLGALQASVGTSGNVKNVFIVEKKSVKFCILSVNIFFEKNAGGVGPEFVEVEEHDEDEVMIRKETQQNDFRWSHHPF